MEQKSLKGLVEDEEEEEEDEEGGEFSFLHGGKQRLFSSEK